MNVVVDAPALPPLEWVNTDEPPVLESLRGRAVLLYFWTADCVNCINALADVFHLRNKYNDGLSVIGIHAPKYEYERRGDVVLKAVNRHALRYPVANDAAFAAWQAYGVQSWPTMVLIDAAGRLHALLPGEGRCDEADRLIGQLLDEAAGDDVRVYGAAADVARPEPDSELHFPGKLLATDSNLWIADSGHHRILECDHKGRILRQFGSGNPTHWDGVGREAAFNAPQGMALSRDKLYVADTGNHAVRRIDLLKGTVDTVAGTGELGFDVPHDSQDPTRISMSAPMDVAAMGDHLYIAVSGQNQIWQLEVSRKRLSVLAGNGQLNLSDGDGIDASFAQPSSLSVVGQQLVIADAAASAVRLLRLLDRRVTTLVGQGLYDFGDASGKRDKARLQHPLALCGDARGLIFIADSYNEKIKVLNMRSGELRALNMPYQFQQPSGLALGAKTFWVANTNAHEIVQVNPESRKVEPLAIYA